MTSKTIDHGSGRILALAGGAGSFLFALVHLYWALGGRIGVPDDVDDIQDRPLFLAYDLAAALIFLLAAWMALELVLPRWWRWSRSALAQWCLWGGTVSLLRGGGGLVQTAFMPELYGVSTLYDAVFAVGGVLFAAAGWWYLRLARRD